MSDKSYTIRPAVPDDAASYNTFWHRLADEPNNGVTFHPGEFTATIDESRERIEKVIATDNQMIFVAVSEQNNVIGECSAFASQRLSRRHNVGLGLSVDQDYRRLGIARGLMQAMLDWAESNPIIERVELEVFTDNIRALNLYLRLGFVLEGTRHKAFRKYGKFKDAYVMALLFQRDDLS